MKLQEKKIDVFLHKCYYCNPAVPVNISAYICVINVTKQLLGTVSTKHQEHYKF